jgi:ubiquinone biosynthesis protein UbiJ
MIPVIVAGVKELNAKLSAENDSLREANASLSARLDKLERKLS